MVWNCTVCLQPKGSTKEIRGRCKKVPFVSHRQNYFERNSSQTDARRCAVLDVYVDGRNEGDCVRRSRCRWLRSTKMQPLAANGIESTNRHLLSTSTISGSRSSSGNDASGLVFKLSFDACLKNSKTWMGRSILRAGPDGLAGSIFWIYLLEDEFRVSSCNQCRNFQKRKGSFLPFFLLPVFKSSVSAPKSMPPTSTSSVSPKEARQAVISAKTG